MPRYDCSSEQPLDAQDAERRMEERWDSSSRLAGFADMDTPVTKYVLSTSRRPRPRCFNCGSYYHALKVRADGDMDCHNKLLHPTSSKVSL